MVHRIPCNVAITDANIIVCFYTDKYYTIFLQLDIEKMRVLVLIYSTLIGLFSNAIYF